MKARSPRIAILPEPGLYLEDGLFSKVPPQRKEDLGLWDLLRFESAKRGISVHTFDLVDSPDLLVSTSQPLNTALPPWFLYIFEPPVVSPHIYRGLPQIARSASRIFTHSPEIASRGGVFRFFSFPIWLPLEETPQDRPLFLAMIQANKRPHGFTRPWQVRGELYTVRLRTAARLARRGLIDVYGPRWDETLKLYSWLPWTKQVRKAWRGRVESKQETLKQYDFCLTFENYISSGYITEKVFDAMAAGSIPVYLGDPGIEQVLPEGSYIDYRRFRSPMRLTRYLESMSSDEKRERRRIMADYIRSDRFKERFSIQTWVDQLLREAEPFLHLPQPHR